MWRLNADISEPILDLGGNAKRKGDQIGSSTMFLLPLKTAVERANSVSKLIYTLIEQLLEKF